MKPYKKWLKGFLKNYLIGKATVHLVQPTWWPITAQCGPAQTRSTACGALTCAPGRNLGLGRESGAPPGPKEAQLRSELPSAVAAGTKSRSAARSPSNPRFTSPAPLRPLLLPPRDGDRRRWRRRGPPRRRVRSPVRERAAVEWARGA
jgi:hypothetical protein